jgi:periplasmic protein TonB
MSASRALSLVRPIAVVVSLAINATLLLLVANLSRHLLPERDNTEEDQRFIPPAPTPKKQVRERQERPRPNAKAGPKALDMPALDLPSGIQAPALLAADLDTKSLVRSKVAQDHALTSRADLVLSEELLDEPPQVLLRTPPRYPLDAQEQGIEGFVVLKILIDRGGRVQEVLVRRCEPHGVFDTAAEEAVRGWTFRPPTYRGEPVQAWVRQRINFRLQ